MLAVGDNWSNHKDQQIAFWGTIPQILGKVEKKNYQKGQTALYLFYIMSCQTSEKKFYVAWKLLNNGLFSWATPSDILGGCGV